MTPPATGTALLILVGFVLPGFVAVLLKERLYEVRGEESTFDRLLTTVYYSLLVYLLPALVVVVVSSIGSSTGRASRSSPAADRHYGSSDWSAPPCCSRSRRSRPSERGNG